LSLDATKSNLYAVNSTVQVNKGGYGTYSATDCNVEFYGVKLDSAQYGVFLCGTGKATVGSIADATAGAMKNLKKSEITSANYLQKDGSSLIAAASNAIIIHQDSGSGKTIKSMMTVKNSTITTEGVTLKDTTDYKDDKKVGASYYFINNYKGSTILMRSANADIDLENAVMGTSNGTLVQSVINYDIDAGSGIYAKDGEEFLGITVNMSGMDVKGNILHQDYQRKMTVNLKGTTLTGAAESGTMAAWNALWATCSADVQKELDHDTSYKTVWGIGMTMDKTSKWSVTKTSSLSSLTVESGAEISAPEGYKATIYENCKMDNTSTFYDYKSGTVVKSLKAGQKYTGVVIVVEKA
ncbi:MAG: hypothetical protein HGA22_14490, partial [Clostridiales bacterium]|nr:hypothetical protein [Clostridiales bacterium]